MSTQSEDQSISKTVKRAIIFLVMGLSLVMNPQLLFLPIQLLLSPGAVMSARHRQKQKQSIRDMENISVALDDYFNAQGHYPIWTQYAPLSSDLLPESFYTGTLLDGWGRHFYYVCVDGSNYTLVSYGSDKKEGGEGYFDRDIVYQNGKCRLQKNGLSSTSCM